MQRSSAMSTGRRPITRATACTTRQLRPSRRVPGPPTDARTGWTTSAIELQIQLGHPVVVWTNFNFAYSGTSTWTAWDGRVVPYTTAEHAVTVIGFDSRAGTVTVIDVGVGLRRTISAAQFSSAIATFGGMGVAVW